MALKEKADKDLTQYNMELKELMRIIDHDRKLKEFMRIKGEERAEMMEGELTSRRKRKDEKEKGDKSEETVEVSCDSTSVCDTLISAAPLKLTPHFSPAWINVCIRASHTDIMNGQSSVLLNGLLSFLQA